MFLIFQDAQLRPLLPRTYSTSPDLTCPACVLVSSMVGRARIPGYLGCPRYVHPDSSARSPGLSVSFDPTSSLGGILKIIHVLSPLSGSQETFGSVFV